MVAIDAYLLYALNVYKFYLIFVICIHIFLMKHIILQKSLNSPIFVIGHKKQVVKFCAGVPWRTSRLVYSSIKVNVNLRHLTSLMSSDVAVKYFKWTVPLSSVTPSSLMWLARGMTEHVTLTEATSVKAWDRYWVLKRTVYELLLLRDSELRPHQACRAMRHSSRWWIWPGKLFGDREMQRRVSSAYCWWGTEK